MIYVLPVELTKQKIKELRTKIEQKNSGLVVSRAYSRGRNGYGKEYKLTVSPDLVGPAVDKVYFDSLLEQKANMDIIKELQKKRKSMWGSQDLSRYSDLLEKFSD